MGTKAKEIVAADVNKIISMLNSALADEWLAYYQYWIGAKVAKGPMKGSVIAELEEHAQDEFKHAGMLVERIIQLGGTPLLKTEDWLKVSGCGYDAPEDPFVKKIVEQNIKGEQCAIEAYKRILDIAKDKDVITYKLALEILEDEVEHEEDLQALLEDMSMTKI